MCKNYASKAGRSEYKNKEPLPVAAIIKIYRVHAVFKYEELNSK